LAGNRSTQLLRYALYRSMEVAPVEENPEFVEDAAEVIGKAKGVILACAEGCARPHVPHRDLSRNALGSSSFATSLSTQTCRSGG